MNAAEIARLYFAENFDWEDFSEDAEATLVNLLERVWQMGIEASDPRGQQGDGRLKESYPILNIELSELKGILD